MRKIETMQNLYSENPGSQTAEPNKEWVSDGLPSSAAALRSVVRRSKSKCTAIDSSFKLPQQQKLRPWKRNLEREKTKECLRERKRGE